MRAARGHDFGAAPPLAVIISRVREDLVAKDRSPKKEVKKPKKKK